MFIMYKKSTVKTSKKNSGDIDIDNEKYGYKEAYEKMMKERNEILKNATKLENDLDNLRDEYKEKMKSIKLMEEMMKSLRLQIEVLEDDNREHNMDEDITNMIEKIVEEKNTIYQKWILEKMRDRNNGTEEDERKIIIKQRKAKFEEEKLINNNCRNYRNGYCSWGDRCKWPHISRRELRKMTNCKHHEQGRCQWGEYCNYKHEREEICSFFEKGICKKKGLCDFKHIVDSKSYTNKQKLDTGVKQKSSPSEQTQENINLIDRAEGGLENITDEQTQKNIDLIDCAERGLAKITDEEIKARAGTEGDLQNITKDLNTSSSDQDNELNNNLINNKHFLEMNTRLDKLESITTKLLSLIESQLTKGV